MSSTGRTPLILAVLLCGGAALVFGATMMDALRVEAAPAAEPHRGAAAEPQDPLSAASPEAVSDPSPALAATAGQEGGASEAHPSVQEPRTASSFATPYPRVTEGELLEAVNLDLFQPDRTAPLMPYLLPGERAAPVPERQDDRRQRGPEIRVVGAALMGNQALAPVQVDDTLPVALLLGESLEGYTLAAVDETGATLVRDDETLTLPVVEPVRSGSSDSRRGDSRNSREQQTIEALQQRLQQAIQGMQGRGGGMGPGGGVFQVMPGQNAVRRLPDGSVEVIRSGTLPGGREVIIRPRGGGGGGGDHP